MLQCCCQSTVVILLDAFDASTFIEAVNYYVNNLAALLNGNDLMLGELINLSSD